jgi:mannan endo-1,4-beta-mannosidase
VLRGVNHPTIYVDRAGDALPEIAKTGANAVRLFWFGNMGVPISAAEPAIRRATELGMVSILELHDSTCEWDLASVSTYWTSAEAIELIERYKASLIINIANETSPPSGSEFRSKYSSLVQQFRRAGIRVPLMIDGGNCGRDYGMLLSQGAALLEADPDANLLFSAHLYDRLSRAEYAELFERTVTQELPFVVGEFANKQPPGCGGTLDYEALISEANAHGIGWLAWSWGDDDPSTDWNSDCGEFDMAATFEFDSLSGWGKEVAVDHPASILNTAVKPASLRGTDCR